MNVDFPHPDGPIIAVTALAFTVKFMSFNACLEPNHAFNAILCIFASGRTCSKLTVFSMLLCFNSKSFTFSVDLGLPL